MRRRSFIGIGLGGGAAVALNPARLLAVERGEPTRHFEVTTTIDLSATSGPAQLWVPVLADRASGQKRLALAWEGDGAVERVRDPQSGAEMLHARWDGAGTPRRLRVVERVATWDRAPALRPERAGTALPAAEWTRWTALAVTPADQARVRSLARSIVAGRRDPEAKLRAIYNWTIANTWRDARTLGCGPGDAALMLREGRLGGKCADINGLVVCLTRAAGIPAREIYGIRLADSVRFKALGRSGDVSKAQHCRAEAWLPGRGWFAIDPADVRKVVLEEKLTVDSPQVLALADTLFGGAEGNWAAYNHAASVRLPAASRAQALRYLMYPTAFTPAGEIDPLDPARFAYRIDSRAVTQA